MNRLTEMDISSGTADERKGTEPIDVTYSYNGDGLLYERVTKDQRIRYYYDEQGKLLAEAKIEVGNAPQMAYFYIYDLNGYLWARQSKTGYINNGPTYQIDLLSSISGSCNIYPLTTEVFLNNHH